MNYEMLGRASDFPMIGVSINLRDFSNSHTKWIQGITFCISYHLYLYHYHAHNSKKDLLEDHLEFQTLILNVFICKQDLQMT